MVNSKNYKWFFEPTTPVEGHFHALLRVLHSQETKYQQMDILDTVSYGKCLVLDGRIQSSVADEFIYHEALVHPAMLSHPRPERVMAVGGGEGATLREMLRYPTVKRALMVDIDEAVVEACKRYLPEMHRSAFDDPRVEVKIEDARAYLEGTEERFDVILIDITEPLEAGPAYLLFTREFYRIALDRLTPHGVVAIQAGMTKVNELLCYTAVAKTLGQVFPVVAPYQTFVPSFGTPWGFIVATKGPDPRRMSAEEVDRLLAQRLIGELLYWDGQTHQHAFSLPKFLRRALEAQDRIIEDGHPLTLV